MEQLMDTLIELAEHLGLITLGAVSGIYLFDLYKRSHRK